MGSLSMEISWNSRVVIKGSAIGEVLHFDAPISFWGGINVINSEVILAGHPQYGLKISGKILVIPNLIGSSSSSAVILQLIHAHLAPKAIILGTLDAILPIGIIAARQMGWNTIPIMTLEKAPFKTGEWIQISCSGLIGTVQKVE
jgi:predicted aconitase with swiveling domain